uniref:Uncharacterized protein n=1 Tax=Cryptosporidium parvum TaxID=5807 RepID=F0X565_CRYPV
MQSSLKQVVQKQSNKKPFQRNPFYSQLPYLGFPQSLMQGCWKCCF